jgi:hypothetical protein
MSAAVLIGVAAAGATTGWSAAGAVVWRLVEGDAESDHDVSAADSYFLDDEANKSLASGEVEIVEGCENALGEVADESTQRVVGGQLLALGYQAVLLGAELLVAGVEIFGPPLDFDHLEQPGLVQVGRPAAFGSGQFEVAFQAASSAASRSSTGVGALVARAASPARRTSGRLSAARS